uniref:Uncharacterized protein n=1 Tax=Alexandrium catenella TaxID=2925 RepID=A0A7S1L101_ALECA|mmetsp:Transcript_104171/g.277155  ORF Transcript_104171/g.277155 Transcript_104171/m.277155 type:complete len:577 (+) Transcript_104171:137-1867(+)|eukprot:CAMPEP_0171175700 /NCGR_PEP_ID=MMETSP0790-20130122/11361_1 /TAXON_ID=2925 /ORGANISM="Alexandrium catenella, Strain OF101" /LENGTH=576 /DNA_ID=CAMNT_0011640579 /DNA_START=125 /DNA_END=1855 /DNA_ORIENTATION=+
MEITDLPQEVPQGTPKVDRFLTEAGVSTAAINDFRKALPNKYDTLDKLFNITSDDLRRGFKGGQKAKVQMAIDKAVVRKAPLKESEPCTSRCSTGSSECKQPAQVDLDAVASAAAATAAAKTAEAGSTANSEDAQPTQVPTAAAARAGTEPLAVTVSEEKEDRLMSKIKAKMSEKNRIYATPRVMRYANWVNAGATEPCGHCGSSTLAATLGIMFHSDQPIVARCFMTDTRFFRRHVWKGRNMITAAEIRAGIELLGPGGTTVVVTEARILKATAHWVVIIKCEGAAKALGVTPDHRLVCESQQKPGLTMVRTAQYCVAQKLLSNHRVKLYDGQGFFREVQSLTTVVMNCELRELTFKDDLDVLVDLSSVTLVAKGRDTGDADPEMCLERMTSLEKRKLEMGLPALTPQLAKLYPGIVTHPSSLLVRVLAEAVEPLREALTDQGNANYAEMRAWVDLCDWGLVQHEVFVFQARATHRSERIAEHFKGLSKTSVSQRPRSVPADACLCHERVRGARGKGSAERSRARAIIDPTRFFDHFKSLLQKSASHRPCSVPADARLCLVARGGIQDGHGGERR